MNSRMKLLVREDYVWLAYNLLQLNKVKLVFKLSSCFNQAAKECQFLENSLL